MASTPVVVKLMYLFLFIFWISCINSYTCNTWQTVDGCNNYETSFWAQTFTDNTPSISVLSSFKEITVEGQYGQLTSIIPHCITSNEGIAISRSLIEAYFARKYTDIYEYRVGNSIAENEFTSFVDIPSSLTFQLPCNVNQNYFTTAVSMNHAIILQYTNGGNGRICLDAGDTLSDAGVIGGDINGSCTTFDYDSNSDMHLTLDTFALLGETYTPTVVSIPTPQPTTIQPSLAAQSLSCSGSCSCSGNRDCIINCEEACIYSTVKCNAGYECTVYCSGEEACDHVDIDANDAKSLSVTCSGYSNTCDSATIDCASTVDGCNLDCTSNNTGICSDITMTCGTGDCSIDCSGSGLNKCSSTDVDASVSSSYACSGTSCSSSVTVITGNPTISPTYHPILHTLQPTDNPNVLQPTFLPLKNTLTTDIPTYNPTYNPTSQPTKIPTDSPSTQPTLAPSYTPTFDPTKDPTIYPINSRTNNSGLVSLSTYAPTISTTNATSLTKINVDTNDSKSNNSEEQNNTILMWIMVAVCTFICCLFLSIVNYFIQKKKKRLLNEGLQLNVKSGFFLSIFTCMNVYVRVLMMHHFMLC